MTGEISSKRDDLRQRLVAATLELIDAAGLPALKARDITAKAGCALGGLYTAFVDLDALIIAANSQTLRAIDAALGEATAGETDPPTLLRKLAAAYLGFARDHMRRWRALFLHAIPEGHAVPDWHVADQARLLDHIVAPLRKIAPAMSENQRRIRARTLFAAVHGIVSISLEERFVGIPNATLAEELDRFVGLLLAGLDD